MDVLPPDVFYNEILDAQLLMPIWAWIILVLVFVGFVSVLIMVYVWFVMKPVSGFGKVGDAATAKGSPTQVFSIWKNRSFVIESMWYYGNILAYGNPLDKMQMWIHNSEKATGVSAKKPVMITRDGFDSTVDFIAEMAVCEIPRIFNEDWGFELVQKTDIKGRVVLDPETDRPIMITRERKDQNGDPYLLSTFADIRKRLALLIKLYPLGIPIPIYQLYDLAKIYQFTPQGQDSLGFGGVLVDDAREWLLENNKEPSSWFAKNAILMICLLVGIVSSALVFVEFPVK